ncbi:MAG: PQQ-binding-like beta-propeller repeat protein [Verrucomicrobiota bacterium]
MTRIPITIFSLLAITGLAIADDWPHYNGADSTRTTDEAIGETNWSGSGPRKVWSAEANTGFSSFTIAGGMAFEMSQREIDGLDQEICIARDAMTGEEIWAAPLSIFRLDNGGGNAGTNDNKGGDGPRTTPTYFDGHVYTLTAEMALHCLDAKTGDEVWSVDILRNYDGRNIKWENAASPLVYDGKVYAYGGGKGKSMMCFDAKSGDEVWADHDYMMTHATPIIANIHDTPQIIFFTQAGLVSLDPDKGDELWMAEFPFKVSTAASPVVAGNIVYCAAGYGVGSAAFEISKSGSSFKAKEIWRLEGNEPVTNHWSTPVHRDGYLYGMFSFKLYGDGPVKCVELKTGKVMWEEEGFGPGNVILTGSGLLALSDSGEVALIEPTPEKYNELGRFKAVGGKCWSTPTLANGHIYVRSTTEAACFDVSGKTAAR